MNSKEEILDTPEANENPVKGFKSRVPKDLMIVIGALLAILGVFFVYTFIESSFILIDGWELHVTDNYYYFRIWIMNTLSFLYGVALIIGGIGLIRQKMIGWTFGTAVVTYPICVIIIGFIRSFIFNNSIWAGAMLVMFLVVLFSGLILTFLLSKTIRKYFNPTRTQYGVSALIVIVLVVYLLILPFLI